jgi:hypothetical protein
MQLDSTFATPKLAPGKQRQAPIDGRRVEGLDGLGQVHAESFLAVEFAGTANQFLREVAVDAPVANLVGGGQGVARNLSPETPVIEFGLLGAQTSFDVAQAATISELREQQTKELIPAGEVFDLAVALGAIDTKLKVIGREKVQELRKNTAAKIHLRPPVGAGKQQNDAKRVAKN